VQEISRRDVVELLDSIVDEGRGTTANRLLAAIRKLFNWCIERGVLEPSPCAGIKAPARETSRERVLSDEELPWLWQACCDQGYPFGPLVQLLILTGQCRDEGLMTLGEASLDERLWTIPSGRAKNGIEHVVPLSRAVVETFEALPRIGGPRGFIFTTTGRTSVSGFSCAKALADRRMLEIARAEAGEAEEDPDAVEIPHWTLHDLRRTAASGMARLGHPPHVVEAVLNHRSGTIRGVAAVSNRHPYAEEKRRALEACSRCVVELVSWSPADNVVFMEAVP
jgi:integrase